MAFAANACEGKTSSMVHARKSATYSARPEQTLREWQARKAAIHRKLVRQHMKRAVADAQKKEGAHKVRQHRARQARPKM